MTDLQKTRNEPIEQLFDMLDDTHAVMIGLDKPGHSMQPMAPQVDEDRRSIWFYSKRDSELGGAIAKSPANRARICAISPDHDYHACISGTMSEEADRTLVDNFWSSVVAAWFEGGKDDANLILLRFDPAEADIWASSGSVIRFAWEVAKANLTDEQPDVGEKTHVVFPAAAPARQAAALG
ncbi:pyridoxamine 5'-phosphate oxidase family protein [uncultured Hoeflea sp.]|uniref:pyridoxamine 5'-phosphate oxidase family protein n=1 Tax=uncultured Hoeflea sp. TaxID=538666 RepID=UPI0030DBBA1B|tara:strand:- start:2989 stop:3531 length:543 start_codon:yes stop_codon:yes gene_type:complete